MNRIPKALGLDHDFDTTGDGHLPSVYAVTDLATSCLGAVGCAVATLTETLGLTSERPDVHVNRRLASLWFASSIHPVGWNMPPIWDAIAGVYETNDGWIKLHTNSPRHRESALSVLDTLAERGAVSDAVKKWNGDELQAAITTAGGVSAVMRSLQEWRKHPQGRAVSTEPLVDWSTPRQGRVRTWSASQRRPLKGLRILDLTRVLAGPVATRTLASFGGEVLRIDPPGWEEPNVVPDVTLGKRCCRLDLRAASDRVVFEHLLSEADMVVHGYRPGALRGLGYGKSDRLKISPDLIEVSIDAYGWIGPWATQRGFDSLVQMSCGIADAGMKWAQANRPTPLPVQALDHATGYLMAAAALRALDDAVRSNGIRAARLSLARTAELLMANSQEQSGDSIADRNSSDFSNRVEHTPWGSAKRLLPPLTITGIPMEWLSSACELGSSLPRWD